jgi:Loader and inhibitor of phage G40P
MNRKEVGKIMNLIAAEYPTFLMTADDDTVNSVKEIWTEALAPYTLEQIKKSFMQYVQMNEYPPKVSHLIKGIPLNNSQNIPDVETTKKMLDEKYAPVPKEQQLSKERINEMLIQTIGRGLKNL